MFWEIVSNLTDAQRSDLLRFVTSVAKPPLFGFRNLNPPFNISRSFDPNAMPTASTCFNILKLPDCRNIDLLRDRLLTAIQCSTGFQFS